MALRIRKFIASGVVPKQDKPKFDGLPFISRNKKKLQFHQLYCLEKIADPSAAILVDPMSFLRGWFTTGFLRLEGQSEGI